MNVKMFEKGQLVLAKDEFYGEYIGRYVSEHSKSWNAVYVKVLACTRYPLQRTIFYAHVVSERRPYEFNSVQTFDAADVEAYEGSIPDYNGSVKASLARAITEAREKGDLNILVKLRTHMAESA